MNPSSPQANSPEQAPLPTGGVEVPAAPMPAEAAPGVGQAGPATGALPVMVPVETTMPAVAAASATDPAVPMVGATASPSVADDVDVIEKEWVDAAEQIVAANANDPRAEEAAVEQLQTDYLKKRYGKDIKPAGDQ